MKYPYVSAIIDIDTGKVLHMAARGTPDKNKRAEIAIKTGLGDDLDNCNWEIVEFGEPGEVVNHLANLGIFTFAGSSLGNIYKSSDYGRTWSLVYSGLSECLNLVASSITDTVYASSKTKAIQSTDDGATWDELDIDWDKSL